MYTPKDSAELRNILEALRTFTSLRGMRELSELLEDAEIALAMEELNRKNQDIGLSNEEEPISG